jgi:signal peptidase I
MIKGLIVTALIIFGLLVFTAPIFYLFLGAPYRINGKDMAPTLTDREYIVAEKFTYKEHDPKRGDIIVYNNPNSREGYSVLRVIGLPGEAVSFLSGVVYVNDVALDEPYINKDIFIEPGSKIREGEHVIVPENSYFCLGDNRNIDTNDSRRSGFIKKDTIFGKYWFRYY